MTDDAKPVFSRVLLKISGEALRGTGSYGISPDVVGTLADELVATVKLGVELAIVVGGGNIFRGVSESAQGMDRSTADYVGMLATVMNAVCLQDALEKRGLPTRVLSAIEMSQLAEPYIRRRAVRHLEKGRVVIFAAGTGNPFFTTDTAASLRAMEIQADVLLKGTKVAGVYDSDPNLNPDARLFASLSFEQALRDEIRVMDSTAFAMCKDNKLPVVVFNMRIAGNIRAVVTGEKLGTTIKPGAPAAFTEV